MCSRRALRLPPAAVAACAAAALVLTAAPAALAASFRNTYSSLPVGSSYSVLGVLESATGGFVTSGSSGGRAFLLKVDGSGLTVFLQSYDGLFAAPALDELPGGGFILAGEALSYDNPSLLQVDAAGVPVWSMSYDLGYPEQGFYAVHPTPDLGFLASGISTLKVDGSGAPVWSKLHIGGGGNVNGTTITRDGGALLTGEGQYGNTGMDYNLVLTRMDAAGAIVWNQVYAGDLYDWSANVRETRDDGAIVTGWTASFGTGTRSCFLLKVSSTGTLEWASTYSGASSSECRDVVQTSDGGYAMTGAVDGSFLLARTDPAGALLWARSYGGSALGYALRQTGDLGYIAAGIGGTSGSSLTLIKTDPDGDALTCNQTVPPLTVAAAGFRTGSNTQDSPQSWTPKVLAPVASSPAVTLQSLCTGGCTPSVAGQASPPEACVGTAIALTATGSTIAGCLGLAQYRWTGSNGYFRDWSPIADASDTPLVSTTYTLDLRCLDPVCQGSSAPIPVIIHELPVIDPGSDRRLCQSALSALGGAPTAQGSTPPYLYTWSALPADPSMSCTAGPACANPTVSPAASTTYTLTVSDAQGCRAAPATVDLAVDLPPTADAGAPRSICATATSILGGAPTAQGNAPFLYTWSALPSDPSMSCTSGGGCSNPSVTPAATTTYTVDIVDAGGCTTRDSVTVDVSIPSPPPDPGNVLRAAKDVRGVPPDRLSLVLSWSAAGGSAIEDRLHRADNRLFAPPSTIVATVAPGAGARLAGEVASSPTLRLYRVTTRNCAGVESAL